MPTHKTTKPNAGANQPAAAEERAPRAGTETGPKARINVVMEGGGVKGIALVGAMVALEEEFQRRGNYDYGRLLGTSAGSIVAALLGAGYRARELSEIVAGPEIARFADVKGIGRVPPFGRFLAMASASSRSRGILRLEVD